MVKLLELGELKKDVILFYLFLGQQLLEILWVLWLILVVVMRGTMLTIANDTKYFENSDYYYSRLTAGVDFRAKNLEAFDSLEKNSMDLYASVRSLYLQDRKRKILKFK